MRRIGCAVVWFCLASCAEPPIAPVYRVTFPEPPAVWKDALGPPSWELVWVDGQGFPQSAVYPADAEPGIDPIAGHASPVLARPFWAFPADGQLRSGVMKSAGAIFPFDADGGLIRLSWEGGVAAEFYLALARARLAAENNAADGALPADKRRPELFDWPRFRALLASNTIPEEVRQDPWLADWDTLAAKTIESGWDSRRIRVAEYTPLAVIVPAGGPWFGTSPFADAHTWKAGDLAELPAGEIPRLLLSPDAYLKYTKSNYVWREWGK